MSRSPLEATESATEDPDEEYFAAWKQLAQRIQQGQSFSGRERNCCFLNTHGTRWADVSSALGLDAIDDSRAIATVDWDHDGDLDLWITNRTSPRIRFFRNDLPRTQSFVAIQLRGEPRQHCPADAIGARVELHLRTTEGSVRKQVQTLTAGDAFLSQSSKILTFGFSPSETIDQVVIRWPGARRAETWTGLAPNQRYLLTQGTGNTAPRTPQQLVARPSVSYRPPRSTSDLSSATTGRLWLAYPPRLTAQSFTQLDAESKTADLLDNRTTWVCLWASWCQPCLSELRAIESHREALEAAGVRVVALSVEALQGDAQEGTAAARQMAESLQLTCTTGMASTAIVEQFDRLRRDAIYRQESLPIPVSFLVDHQGYLRAIYTGAVTMEQLLEDAKHTKDASEEANRQRAVPFAGRWSEPHFVTNPIAIATIFRDERQFDEARQYLENYLREHPVPAANDRSPASQAAHLRAADVYHLLGRLAVDQDHLPAAQDHFQRALVHAPRHVPALLDVGDLFYQRGNLLDARRHYELALAQAPHDPRTLNKLGMTDLAAGAGAAARKRFEAAVRADESYFPAANNLAWLCATSPEASIRDGKLAVKLAEHWHDRLPSRADVSDTLAAAYAEDQQFDRAVATAATAIELARAAGLSALVDQIARRQVAYRNQHPYREPSPSR